MKCILRVSIARNGLKKNKNHQIATVSFKEVARSIEG
jgi:hypothetical protein